MPSCFVCFSIAVLHLTCHSGTLLCDNSPHRRARGGGGGDFSGKFHERTVYTRRARLDSAVRGHAGLESICTGSLQRHSRFPIACVCASTRVNFAYALLALPVNVLVRNIPSSVRPMAQSILKSELSKRSEIAPKSTFGVLFLFFSAL